MIEISLKELEEIIKEALENDSKFNNDNEEC